MWATKHRPKSLQNLTYHAALSLRLERLGSSGDITHMLFYGPDGAGKKTRVRLPVPARLPVPVPARLPVPVPERLPAPARLVQNETGAACRRVT